MNPIQNIASQTKEVAEQKVIQDRHIETVLAMTGVEKAVYNAVQQLTGYLNGQVTRTQVLNQPTSISTPDVENVVQAVKDLSTITENKQIDLSPLIEGIKSLEQQLQAIPKEVPTFEQKDTVAVSNLSELDLGKVVDAINDIQLEPTDLSPLQKTMLEAVKAVQGIKPEQIDVSPLQKSLKAVTDAVKAIKIPEVPKADLSTLEEEAKQQNKTLQKILEKPVGGGGGGGSSWPAVTPSGVTQPLNLTTDGKLIVEAAAQEGGASEEQQLAQSEILEEIEHAIQSIAAAKGIAGDLRVTLLGGTTAVTGTLTGVTTVTTVTGLTNIGGIPAVQLVPSNQNIAAVLTNINNITV